MMPEDEEFLADLYRSLNQEEILPGDERYVSFHEFDGATGPDVVRQLVRDVSWTTAGSIFFLTGTRGCGKSTQLRRVKAELAQRGFAPVLVSAEEYVNLRQRLDVVEFLYALVGGISDAVAEEGWLPREQALERGWGALRRWFVGLRGRLEVTTEASLESGVDVFGVVDAKVNVKAQLRQDESFVKQLNTYLGGRVSELAAEANKIVDDLVDQLREAWARDGRGDWKGLVVLFDDLDHVRGVDFSEVRQALQMLLDTHSATIKLRNCRTVLVVPPWVNIDYEPIRMLSSVKVRTVDGADFQPGIEALTEMISKRVPGRDVSRAFADPALLRQIVLDSGGHLRDLLRLVREACVSASGLPFDSDLVDRARGSVRETLLPLAADEKEALAHIAASHEVFLPSQDSWGALAGLFDRHLVLGYKNGEFWYGVHPLVADDLGT